MAAPQNRLEQIIKALRDRGYRLTPQRLAMLKIIAASLGHPDAEQIYERMQAGFPTTSLATIYKTLALLKEMGEVLELNFATVGSHYDGKKTVPASPCHLYPMWPNPRSRVGNGGGHLSRNGQADRLSDHPSPVKLFRPLPRVPAGRASGCNQGGKK